MLHQPRSTQRYESEPREDEPTLVKGMLGVVRRRPRWGYRRVAWQLRQEGWRVSDTRVYRLWRREGLKVPVKRRKKRRLGRSENGCVRRRAESKDHVWAWDFVFDHTTSGSQLKWLSIVDEHTRECLALKVARSITSEDVIDTLADLFAIRGVPKCIRCDNGPEFMARRSGTGLVRSTCRPYTSSRAARGRTAMRRASTAACGRVLALEVFDSLSAAKRLTKQWQEDYNHHRPHSSLGYVTPIEFAPAVLLPLRLRLRLSLRSSSTAEIT